MLRPHKIPVTVIIPVKNEERNLPFCLQKVVDFDQVIIVDSSSTDNTPRIAREYNYEYHNFVWNGKFPKKRNWALENLEIRNEWVLFLDADEYLSEEFIYEINERVKRSNCNGYLVKYQNYFMGKNLKHGDIMRKLPLFNRTKGAYEKVDENFWTNLDMEVHEHPIIDGKIGKISSPILHNDYKGLEHYIAKHNSYSTWEAHRYLHLKRSTGGMLTLRQKFKYYLFNTNILPLAYFIYSYFIKLGFLDGIQGYHFAIYKSYYFFQIKTKIREIDKIEPI